MGRVADYASPIRPFLDLSMALCFEMAGDSRSTPILCFPPTRSRMQQFCIDLSLFYTVKDIGVIFGVGGITAYRVIILMSLRPKELAE